MLEFFAEHVPPLLQQWDSDDIDADKRYRILSKFVYLGITSIRHFPDTFVLLKPVVVAITQSARQALLTTHNSAQTAAMSYYECIFKRVIAQVDNKVPATPQLLALLTLARTEAEFKIVGKKVALASAVRNLLSGRTTAANASSSLNTAFHAKGLATTTRSHLAPPSSVVGMQHLHRAASEDEPCYNSPNLNCPTKAHSRPQSSANRVEPPLHLPVHVTARLVAVLKNTFGIDRESLLPFQLNAVTNAVLAFNVPDLNKMIMKNSGPVEELGFPGVVLSAYADDGSSKVPTSSFLFTPKRSNANASSSLGDDNNNDDDDNAPGSNIFTAVSAIPRATGPVSLPRHSFVMQATGQGKSLCYQLPPLLTGLTTVVISPLISLMQDQVAGLNARGVRALYLSRTTSSEEYDALLRGG